MNVLLRVALCAVGLILLGATPAKADWTLGNHELTLVSSGAQSGSGYSSAAGASGASVEAYSANSTNGTVTAGGAEYTVTRVFTKVGSPANLLIEVNLSVEGNTWASILDPLFNGSTGADSRAKASGSNTHFPNAQKLDEDAQANAPAGPPDDLFSENNSGDVVNKMLLLTATTTVSGSIYANASTNVNTNGTTSADAMAYVSFAISM